MLSGNEKIKKTYYDLIAAKYESMGRINREGNKKRIYALLRDLTRKMDDNIKVLDVCCGAGLYLNILKNFVKDEKLYGVDISTEMLKISSQFCDNLYEGSVYALPFNDNEFDLVTCSSALHHLEDLEKAISEIYRVLKPGGYFISDYDNNYHFNLINNFFRKTWKIIRIYPVFIKLFKKLNRKGTAVHKFDDDNIDEMPVTELHKRSEFQNYHYGGVNGYSLENIMENTGFKETQVFAFSSDRWNTGVRFNFLNSVFNGKIRSVAKK